MDQDTGHKRSRINNDIIHIFILSGYANHDKGDFVLGLQILANLCEGGYMQRAFRISPDLNFKRPFANRLTNLNCL